MYALPDYKLLIDRLMRTFKFRLFNTSHYMVELPNVNYLIILLKKYYYHVLLTHSLSHLLPPISPQKVVALAHVLI